MRRWTATTVLLLSGLVVLLAAPWIILGWPPPLVLLRHGLPPMAGRAAGMRWVDDKRFVRVEPGATWARILRNDPEPGSLSARLGRLLGIRIGAESDEGWWDESGWVESNEPLWISALPEERVSGNGYIMIKESAWHIVIDEDAVAGHLREESGRVSGSFRLPTRDELGHAVSIGAVRTRGSEWVQESSLSSRLILIGTGDFRSPGREKDQARSWFPFRLVWVPPAGDG